MADARYGEDGEDEAVSWMCGWRTAVRKRGGGKTWARGRGARERRALKYSSAGGFAEGETVRILAHQPLLLAATGPQGCLSMR